MDHGSGIADCCALVRTATRRPHRRHWAGPAKEWTSRYPWIAAAVSALACCLIDGAVAVVASNVLLMQRYCPFINVDSGIGQGPGVQHIRCNALAKLTACCPPAPRLNP
jgi:hypothetical protein